MQLIKLIIRVGGVKGNRYVFAQNELRLSISLAWKLSLPLARIPLGEKRNENLAIEWATMRTTRHSSAGQALKHSEKNLFKKKM